jgi:hypothetical protein
LIIALDQRLKEKGKDGKEILCAIMRKLVHIIFGVLKSSKKYDPIINQLSLDKKGIYNSSEVRSCQN